MKNTKRALAALALTGAALSLSGTAQAAEPAPVAGGVRVVDEDFDRDLVGAGRIEQDELMEALVSDFLDDDDNELIRVDNEDD
ncbi:hypothetical protein ACIRPK_35395 [Kitasatospora sp. NPDC101801]|uniref:hypothetical protein n=1 Tax=Kitasatospora sp. NPDC101801 TaxID=3364103 RepID=UPI0037FF5A3E